MRCLFKECDLVTRSLSEFHDLTDEIINYVLESGIKEGQVLIHPMHTTVGIFLNEAEPRLMRDFKRELDVRVPFDNRYFHDDISKRTDCPPDEPINCHAHLKSAFFSNPSLSLIVHDGKLQIGKYQRILLAEFDGPCPRTHKSRRRYVVSIIGE